MREQWGFPGLPTWYMRALLIRQAFENHLDFRLRRVACQQNEIVGSKALRHALVKTYNSTSCNTIF